MQSIARIVVSLAALCLVQAAFMDAQRTQAQSYPNRPVRMIIPFAPGGASDFIGRILQPKLTELLGQQVVAENRPGASGNIGVELAARATPDGYTFLLGNVSSMGINPSMFPNFPIRSTRDFIPITLVVDVPGALGIHGGLPPNNLKEFIAYVKANQGKLSYGSAGYASAQRMASSALPNSCFGAPIAGISTRPPTSTMNLTNRSEWSRSSVACRAKNALSSGRFSASK